MEDQQQNHTSAADNKKAEADSERTKQVTVAGWTAGLSAFFLMGALAANGTWPMAIGVIAVAGMVVAACYFMLKQP